MRMIKFYSILIFYALCFAAGFAGVYALDDSLSRLEMVNQ